MKIIVTEKELGAVVELSKEACAVRKAFNELINEPNGDCDACKYADIFNLKGVKRYKNIAKLEKRTSENLTTIFLLTINEDLVIDVVDAYGMILNPLFQSLYPLIGYYKNEVMPAIKRKFSKWS